MVCLGPTSLAQTPTWQALLAADAGDTNAALTCLSDDRDDNAVAIDAAGHTIVAGCTNDGNGHRFLAIKYAADGSIVWTSQRHSAVPLAGKQAVAVDEAGNVFVAGYANSGANNRDIVTAKYDGATGAFVWGVRFDGAGLDDEARDLALDSVGNLVVSGFTTRADGNRDLLVMKLAGASGDQLWLAQNDGASGGNDVASVVSIDASDDVIAAGYVDGEVNAEFVALKLAGDTGATLWLSQYTEEVDSVDFATSVAVDSAGDVIVAGVSTGNDLDQDYVILKYDGDTGTELWTSLEVGPEGNPAARPTIVVGANDDIFLSGSIGPRDSTDMLVQKYAAASGEQIWSRSYDGLGAGLDEAEALAIDTAGDVFVTGSSTGLDGTIEFLTVKVSADTGDEQWQARFDTAADEGDFPAAIVVDSAGDPVIAGSSRNMSFAKSDFAVVKLSGSDGSEQWRATEGLLEFAQIFGCGHPVRSSKAMAVDSAGDTYVAGCQSNGSNTDTVIAKLSADGDWIWRAVYDGGLTDVLVALTLDSAGDVIVAGTSYHPETDADFLALKLDGATGAALWTARYTGPTPTARRQFASTVTVDSNDDVIVAGSGSAALPGSGGPSIAVVKFAGSSGDTIWASQIDTGGALVNAVVTNAAGDVFVAGQVGYQLAVAKFSGSTGSELWLELSGSFLGANALANAAAIDSFGNVLLTGVVYRVGTGADLLTVKLDGLDGSMLWAADGAGPGTIHEAAHGVAIDAAGDVIVTGFYEMSEGDTDYVTIKYDGINGDARWESRYDGTSGQIDAAYDLVVANSGDILVTGQSQTDCGFSQLVTVKYAAATGEEVWFARSMSTATQGSGIRLADDGSVRVAGTAYLDRGQQIGVVRIDEGGVVERILKDGFEGAVPVLLECPDPAAT